MLLQPIGNHHAMTQLIQPIVYHVIQFSQRIHLSVYIPVPKSRSPCCRRNMETEVSRGIYCSRSGGM